MPKGFSETEKQVINAQLLEQGLKLFSAYGLKKTNVEEIARAAGISKGAFYNFYESKEELFMDAVEQAEVHVRQEILAAIDEPGPTPRIRLFNILKRAFTAFETVPILQFFTSSDYNLLFRRLPADKIKEHMAHDQGFFVELVARCRDSGIPVRADLGQISGLMYQLVLNFLHKDDFGQDNLAGSADLLIELVAAYCLGEVESQR